MTKDNPNSARMAPAESIDTSSCVPGLHNCACQVLMGQLRRVIGLHISNVFLQGCI